MYSKLFLVFIAYIFYEELTEPQRINYVGKLKDNDAVKDNDALVLYPMF